MDLLRGKRDPRVQGGLGNEFENPCFFSLWKACEYHILSATFTYY